MRQVIHNLGSGDIDVVDVPRPRPGPGEILVANEASVLSPGTERMLIGFGTASLVDKARREPARVRQVVDKAITDGVGATIRAVRARLEDPIPLGYSAAGVVLEVGPGVDTFSRGDRVATNGAHAELVTVPARLAARIPDSLDSKHAAFTTIAAVALQALRDAEVEVGDVVAVIGLGLVGQLVARVAVASGCRVVAFDPDSARAELAVSESVEAFDRPESLEERARYRTDGEGVDAVLIATDVGARAAGGPSPTELAVAVARQRAVVVLVGNGDPTLDRRAFYDRELRFVVSHAYGPGRDEPGWESGRIDYPRGRVRWTSQRNFETVLDLMSRGLVDVDSLVQEVRPLEEAAEVYRRLESGEAAVGTLFTYAAHVDGEDTVALGPAAAARAAHPGVAVIGAGNFARRILIPALVDTGVQLRMIASLSGLSSVIAGQRYGFESSTTNLERVLGDDDVDVVFIATRHDSHADLAARALRAGKHVWLEKPLAITPAQLDELETVWREVRSDGVQLNVGFNRRFAPVVRRLTDGMRGLGPFSFVYTVNAGALPSNHWLIDPQVGGGRIVGEACHFVDLLRHLAQAPIQDIHATTMDPQNATLTVKFSDGSVGTVHYLSVGHPGVPKERLEVFGGGRIWRIDNFRELETFGEDFAPLKALRNLGRARREQDKGHRAAVEVFLETIRRGEPSPVPFEEAVEVTRAIFDALNVA
jgi:predicted dehydrogenase